MGIRVLLFVSLLLACAPQPLVAGKLQDIKSRGVLMAGVRDSVAPFGYLDEATNQIVGFEVDICRYIAEKLDARLELVPVTGADRIPMLLQGNVDMVVATMTHKYERDEVVDFSITYFMDGQRLMVPRDSLIKSSQDLVGKNLGTAKGSSAEKNIKVQQPEVTVFTYETFPQAFLAMKRGEVDGIISEATTLQGLRLVDENPDAWTILDEPISREPYAVALPENDSDFRDFINKTLSDMWNGGAYAKIYEKWFGPESKYYTPLAWEMEIWP